MSANPDKAGEARLFREAVADATPIPRRRAVLTRPLPPPRPVMSERDEQEVLAELLEPLPWDEDVENGDELRFLRPGLARTTLRRLRRGDWVIQRQLDLHGHNREEARVALSEFLARCLRDGMRCVRVIHGKGRGSPGRSPVLKDKVKRWLMQREEVLAFCEARPVDGGSGAVLVLLRSPTRG